jgi:cathepsin L
MWKSAIVLSLLAALGLAQSNVIYDVHEEIIHEEWEAFKIAHTKLYFDDREEVYRRKIYIENRKRIAAHNVRAHNKRHNYFLKINEYGDLLHTEFLKTMNGYKMGNRLVNGSRHLKVSNVVLPTKVDWRTEGYVTPVKNQKHCGSCWAFSSTGALEGQHFRKTGKLVSLSEQNLVDCSEKYGNNGCNGGLMDNAFEYIRANHGIDTEAAYPYEGKDGKCRYKTQNKGADDLGAVDIPSGDEKALQEAIATVGPVSVAIDASHESFQFYSHGVYDEPDCSSEELDHGVLLVGYDVEPVTNKKFWLVKNSWGTTWGKDGYIQMARENNNQCGIASAASYPSV